MGCERWRGVSLSFFPPLVQAWLIRTPAPHKAWQPGTTGFLSLGIFRPALTDHVPCPASQHVVSLLPCLTWSLTQADGIRPQQGPSTPCLGAGPTRPNLNLLGLCSRPAEILTGRITCLPTTHMLGPRDDSPLPRPSPMSLVTRGLCTAIIITAKIPSLLVTRESGCGEKKESSRTDRPTDLGTALRILHVRPVSWELDPILSHRCGSWFRIVGY